MHASPWKARADIIESLGIRVSRSAGEPSLPGPDSDGATWPCFVPLSLYEAKRCRLPGPIYFGPRRIEISSFEHSCEMPSMNDDVPARTAEGGTSFYAGKSAKSLNA